MAVDAMPPGFSKGSGAGGGQEKVAPEGRVVGLERGTSGETVCKMMFPYEPADGRLIKIKVSGMVDGHYNGIMARSNLPRRRLQRHSALAAPMTGGAGPTTGRMTVLPTKQQAEKKEFRR